MDQDLIATPVDRMVCSSCKHELDVSGRPAFSTMLCPHCGTELCVPVMLGQFLLVARMGSGGMGAVYRGLDTALNRFVAIKVMKAALGEDAKLVESFIREAQAAAALNHRNIVQIYSCGQVQGQPYIVMELVSGGRMSEMFTKDEPMDEEKLLKLSLDVVEGLSAAHAAGLVHGDIKPENILVDRSGTGKIVDFGLAQFVNAQKNRGEIWGTPYYISPERARGNKADHRSDVYSLGATMFHALTGQPPFDGDTPVDVVLARLKHPPPDLRQLRPDLTDQTVAIINRMMAADPSLRYPTSASLKSDMQAALEAAREARKAARAKARQAPRRSPALFIVAACLAVAAGLFVFLSSRKEAPAPVPVAQAPKPKPEPASPADELFTVTQVKGPDGVERPRMEIRLFTPEEEKAIAAAFARLDGPDPMAAHRELSEIARKMPKQTLRARWMPLLMAIPEWAAGEGLRAESAIAEMVRRFKAPQPPEHPIHMAKVLGQHLMGQLEAAERTRLLQAWPAWFGDLMVFSSGVQDLAAGNHARGAQALDRFIGSASAQPVWVSALKPAARRWREQVAAWNQVHQQIGVLLAAGRPETATALLDQFQAVSPSWFAKAVQADRQRSAATASRQSGSAAVGQARRHRVEVQEDLRKVDAALAEVSTMVSRTRDYRKAALSVSTLPSAMQTPEGEAAAVWLRASLEQLEKLKTMIIRATELRPYNRADGCDLGGDVISANALGIRISLDGRAVSTREWEAIPPRSLIRMTEFLAASPGLESAEQAQMFISLALFCVVNGAVEQGSVYARKALASDPASAPLVRQFLPGLITEG